MRNWASQDRNCSSREKVFSRKSQKYNSKAEEKHCEIKEFSNEWRQKIFVFYLFFFFLLLLFFFQKSHLANDEPTINVNIHFAVICIFFAWKNSICRSCPTFHSFLTKFIKLYGVYHFKIRSSKTTFSFHSIGRENI